MGNKSLTQASPCSLQDKLTLVISAEHPVVSVLGCKEYNWWKAGPAEQVPETRQLGQRGPSAVAFTCHP